MLNMTEWPFQHVLSVSSTLIFMFASMQMCSSLGLRSYLMTILLISLCAIPVLQLLNQSYLEQDIRGYFMNTVIVGIMVRVRVVLDLNWENPGSSLHLGKFIGLPWNFRRIRRSVASYTTLSLEYKSKARESNSTTSHDVIN